MFGHLYIYICPYKYVIRIYGQFIVCIYTYVCTYTCIHVNNLYICVDVNIQKCVSVRTSIEIEIREERGGDEFVQINTSISSGCAHISNGHDKFRTLILCICE